MKTIKTSELTGAALDYAVAIAEGYARDPEDRSAFWKDGQVTSISRHGHEGGWGFRPSVDWAQGGPIMQREQMEILPLGSVWQVGFAGFLEASGHGVSFCRNCRSGPTVLIAAMRCWAWVRFGDTVEVPEELA